MSLHCYQTKQFRAASLEIIDRANKIIRDYQAKGYDLTLRQLYYQFVAKDLIPNTERSYKRLGKIISDGRLAGLISWEAIVDRTRRSLRRANWADPTEIIKATAEEYAIDLWVGQPYRPRVWIEKEALVGVISRVCDRWDVPYMACRGYPSQSIMWRQSQAMYWQLVRGLSPVIIHLGDHDPSGIDMTADIQNRVSLFEVGQVEVRRIALNMDQIDEWQPPPNPAKLKQILTSIAGILMAGVILAFARHELFRLYMGLSLLVGLYKLLAFHIYDSNQYFYAYNISGLLHPIFQTALLLVLYRRRLPDAFRWVTTAISCVLFSVLVMGLGTGIADLATILLFSEFSVASIVMLQALMSGVRNDPEEGGILAGLVVSAAISLCLYGARTAGGLGLWSAWVQRAALGPWAIWTVTAIRCRSSVRKVAAVGQWGHWLARHLGQPQRRPVAQSLKQVRAISAFLPPFKTEDSK